MQLPHLGVVFQDGLFLFDLFARLRSASFGCTDVMLRTGALGTLMGPAGKRAR